MYPCVDPFYFVNPSSILIVGPSGCGKTVFVEKCLKERSHLFPQAPACVHYCYGIWQDKYRDFQKQGIHLHQGIPSSQDLTRWYQPSGGGLLVLDDLMDEGSNDKRVLDLFTKDSHHRNVTVLYLCQDMFPPGKYAKTISRNAHYIVAFKNLRDQLGVRNLALQCFPKQWASVLEAYEDATARPYGYLLFDLHPSSQDGKRLKGNVLQNEGYTCLYQTP